MLDSRTGFDLHRWAHDGLAVRTSAAPRGLRRHTVHQSRDDPNPPRPRIRRARTLAPCTDDSERR